MHEPAYLKKQRIGDDDFFDNFRFSIVRNPYERAISQYLHRRHFHDDVDDLYSYLHKVHIRKQYYPQPADSDYLARLFWPQVNFLMDENYEHFLVPEINIGHFEDLENEVNRILSTIDVNVDLPYRTQLTTDHTPYAQHLTPLAKKTIDFIYHEDFEKLGYSKVVDPDESNARRLFKNWEDN